MRLLQTPPPRSEVIRICGVRSEDVAQKLFGGGKELKVEDVLANLGTLRGVRAEIQAVTVDRLLAPFGST